MTTESNTPQIARIARTDRRILATLLVDRTLSRHEPQRNISWATSEYGYMPDSPISIEQVSGEAADTIQPRVYKHPTLQASRSKDRAEVFTPAWLCNAQNNLVDERWFKRRHVFNTETESNDGQHSWVPTDSPIEFPEDRTWMQYVRCRRLEMTCGEAPYLASRYDTTTGEPIHISRRIGIFDRKIRVINENTPPEPTKANRRQWLRKAYQALQSVYGFDWQGDNVFLSRETLFTSFCEYYQQRWSRPPHHEAMRKAAEIISWNIWQMDGIRFTIPYSTEPCLIMEWHGIEPLGGNIVKFANLIGK